MVQVSMEEKIQLVGPRERQIIELLLQGCDNSEIARDLHIAERTVKAHFNRLFLRFGIKGGIKRVKLATLLYRRQLWLEKQQTAADRANANNSSLSA
jgi:DNA-binding NarL/FixJ family response regulator